MLQIDTTGVILIDVQGKLAKMVHQSDRLISNIAKFVEGAKILDLPIIWLEQYPKGLGKTVEEISSLLTDYKPIEKFTFDCYADENVRQAVIDSGRKQWIVCGIEAHICVYQTSMALLNNNYKVELLTDCISSRLPENVQLATNKLQSRGVGLTNIEMCLYELLKSSKHPKFKEILPLIK